MKQSFLLIFIDKSSTIQSWRKGESGNGFLWNCEGDFSMEKGIFKLKKFEFSKFEVRIFKV